MTYILTALFAVLATVLLFRLLTVVSKHRNRRTGTEVADAIEKHIQGAEGPWDWDDFTSRPIADNRLDAIRTRCIQLDYAPTEERLRELRKIALDLRNEVTSKS